MSIPYEPMLAKMYDEKASKLIGPGTHVVEEKFDGHRAIVQVAPGVVTAWSRTGKPCADKFNGVIRMALSGMPSGVYDGELIVPGGHSYDVANMLNRSKLQLVLFDVLQVEGFPCTSKDYHERRTVLEQIMSKQKYECLRIAPVWEIDSVADLIEHTARIWAENGEGVIIKRKKFSAYKCGKRADAFLKLKQCGSTVVEVMGFEAGTTSDYNVVVVRDDAGNVTKVKLKNDATRQQALDLATGVAVMPGTPHPWIGKRLRIEYHERTPDGSYRHPRWDRWEDE